MFSDFSRLKPSISDLMMLRGLWRQHPRYRGCVAHWIMNDGGGLTLRDISRAASTDNGTLTSGPTWVSGLRGSVLSFDGEDDYVQGAAVLPVTSTFTATCWFKRQGASGGSAASTFHTILKSIAGDSTQPRILVTSAGDELRLQQRVVGGAVHSLIVSNAPFADNQWHPIGYTFDGTTVSAYIDGRPADSNTSAAILTGTTPWEMGQTSTTNHLANGHIDDVRIYNRALSAPAMASLVWDPYAEFEWAAEHLTRSYFFMHVPTEAADSAAAMYYRMLLG